MGSRCAGFRAKSYITRNAIEKFPALEICAKYWNAAIVDKVPQIKPYERALEWGVPKSSPSGSPDKSDAKNNTVMIVVIVLSILAVLTAVTLTIVFCCCCKPRHKDGTEPARLLELRIPSPREVECI